MAEIIPLPRYYGPRIDGRTRIGRARKAVQNLATIMPIKARNGTPVEDPSSDTTAYQLFRRATKIDDNPDQREHAIALYKRAIALDPRMHLAYTNLGNLMYRASDSFAARLHYDQALQIDPRQPEALYNLGYLELEADQPFAAIHLFRRAIASDPKLADAHFNLAQAYEQIGAPHLAAPHWQRYIELEPSGQWTDIARRHV